MTSLPRSGNLKFTSDNLTLSVITSIPPTNTSLHSEERHAQTIDVGTHLNPNLEGEGDYAIPHDQRGVEALPEDPLSGKDASELSF
jgi:hypothetical protein